MKLPVRIHSGFGQVRSLGNIDVEFTKTDRGGPTTASLVIPERLDFSDPAVQALSRIRIDDPFSGRCLWEGYIDLPGRSVSEAGETWHIAAAGAASVLDDLSKPYFAVDRELSHWDGESGNANFIEGGRAEVSTLPTDEEVDALMLQLPVGVPIGNLSHVSMRYMNARRAGQLLGGFGYTVVCGRTAGADFETQSRVYTPANVQEYIHQDLESTSALTRWSRWTTWANSNDRLLLFHQRVSGGATTIANELYWAAFYDVHVVAKLLDSSGAGISRQALYQNGEAFAHEIVIDALQHLTSTIDIPHGIYDKTFSYGIDQFSYPDGVRMSDVLRDLALLDPDMWWKVLPAISPTGKHGFELGRYPAADPANVRYEFDAAEGWDAPGGELALANRLRVYWMQRKQERSSVYSSDEMLALDQWGRVRDAEAITLGSELGSQKAADRIGPALLDLLATVPYAGTVRVTKPVYDKVLGGHVMPWEVEPGYLASVKDLSSPPMRISEVSYRTSDSAASVTLGTPVLSTDQLVAKLARQRRRSDRGGAGR